MNRSEENRVLLHILKNNPRDGEVYITWCGETFVGYIQDIAIKSGIDEITSFTLSGVIRNEQ